MGCCDGCFCDGEFLARGVGEDELILFFAADESGGGGAVGFYDCGDAEGEVDVAVGIEDVFDEAFKTAIADAVEIGSEAVALAGDLVAGGALLPENELPGSGISRVGTTKKPRVCACKTAACLCCPT